MYTFLVVPSSLQIFVVLKPVYQITDNSHKEGKEDKWPSTFNKNNAPPDSLSGFFDIMGFLPHFRLHYLNSSFPRLPNEPMHRFFISSTHTQNINMNFSFYLLPIQWIRTYTKYKHKLNGLKMGKHIKSNHTECGDSHFPKSWLGQCFSLTLIRLGGGSGSPPRQLTVCHF